ncbi:DUF2059 domain-containing protein [Thermodesulfobacteriota bacterium]
MMRKFTTIIIFVLVFSLLGCVTAKKPKVVAVSDNESKRESVEELLALTDAEDMIDTIYSQMSQMFQGMGQQLGVKPSEQELFDKFMSKMIALLKDEMSWDKMKEPMMKIYLKHYSEKEIQDQITFYKSDSGQSMIGKQPEVMKDTMMLSQEALKDFIPKLQKISKELEEELAASRSYNIPDQIDLESSLSSEDPWVGIWKLNPEKSKLQSTAVTNIGDSVVTYREIDPDTVEITSIRVLGNGLKTVMWQCTVPKSGGIQKYQKGGPGMGNSIVKTVIDDHTQYLTLLQGGKQLSISTIVLSEDGRTYTLSSESKDAMGQSYEQVQVFEKQ